MFVYSLNDSLNDSLIWVLLSSLLWVLCRIVYVCVKIPVLNR